MAIQLFDAIGIFRSNASAFKRTVRGAMGSVRSTIGRAGAAITSFGKIAIKTFLAAGAGILGFVSLSIFQFAKLERGIAEITSLFGVVGQQARDIAGELQGIVQSLVVGFGQTTPSAIKATYDAVSAGIRRADIGKFMKGAARLAVAGVTDISQSVDILTTLINAFGLSAKDTERVSDALFTTVRLGKTTIDELSQSMGLIAPIAAGAGISLEEMLAALATLTSQGLTTSIAITSLKAVVQSLLKPTAEAIELAEELGLDFNAQALASRGLRNVMRDLEEATGGNVTQMAKMLGGVEALNAAMVFTSNTGARKFAEGMVEMDKKTGATRKGFEIMADTILFQWGLMSGAVKVAIQSIGEFFGPAFKGMIEQVNEWIKQNNVAFNRFMEAARAISRIVTVALLEVFEKAFPKMTEWVETLTEKIQEWAEQLSRDPQASVDAIKKKIKEWIGTIRDLLIRIKDAIVAVAAWTKENKGLVVTLAKLSVLIVVTSWVLSFVGALAVLIPLIKLLAVGAGALLGLLGLSVSAVATAFIGLVGAAGVGWVFGRWLDTMGKKVGFFKTAIDGLFNAVVRATNALLQLLGLQQRPVTLGIRSQELIEQGAVVPEDIETFTSPRGLGGAVGKTEGGMNIESVEIRIDGAGAEPEDIANAVGRALLDLGRLTSLNRGGVQVTP